LSKIAILDPLTWLYNRLWLRTIILPKIFNNLERNKVKIAWLFIDLDHFKKINDTMWHDMWDQVLKKLADILNEITRENDYLIRLWWDEFLLIWETDKWWIEELCKKINKEVEKWLWIDNFWDTGLFVTASIWALFIKSTDNNELEWKRVSLKWDELLYESKKERNCYTIYDENL
jgi:diguanylate cyclase (GGDEF)-like protein